MEGTAIEIKQSSKSCLGLIISLKPVLLSGLTNAGTECMEQSLQNCSYYCLGLSMTSMIFPVSGSCSAFQPGSERRNPAGPAPGAARTGRGARGSPRRGRGCAGGPGPASAVDRS